MGFLILAYFLGNLFLVIIGATMLALFGKPKGRGH